MSAGSVIGKVPDQAQLDRPPPVGKAKSLKRAAKDRAKRSLRGLFELGQRLGLDILPRHFYSQIPDIRALRRDQHWKQPRTMAGVRGADLLPQFQFVEACCPPDVVERLRHSEIHRDACAANGEPGFGPVDAEFLYAFIREVRPQKVVQVGCGVSTAVILRAVDEVPSYTPEIVCVEPYPTRILHQLDRAGRIRLIAEQAQQVSLDVFTDFDEGGLLFVDSTHTVKPGSEVNRLVLEVLPRLRTGVWVHFHDIYFPYDYQRGLLDDELFFCNETALLHAFLINNDAFAIRASLSMLHYADDTRLQRSLPGYRPAANDHGLRASSGDFPASIYLEVVG
jgi:predicted O-methyltransferase YrrM